MYEYLQNPTNGSYMKYAIDAVKEQLHTEDAALKMYRCKRVHGRFSALI